MKTKLKRNLALSALLSLLSVGLLACNPSSSNKSAGDAPPDQTGPVDPLVDSNALSGVAFDVNFEAKGAVAQVTKDHIVILISSDEVKDCSGIAMGKSLINLAIPKNQAGPFDETNLAKAPSFAHVDAEDPSAINGVRDFLNYEISILALTADEIELSLELRDDVGSVVSGTIKAQICQ
jgi:hypothetical protein